MTCPPVEERRRTPQSVTAVGLYNPGIIRMIDHAMQDVDTHDGSYQQKDPALYLATYSLRNHLTRVGRSCTAVATKLGLPAECVELAGVSGHSHDWGKLEKICQLYREKRILEPEERLIMGLHAPLSAERVGSLKPLVRKEDHPFLDKVMHIVRCHHKPYWLLEEELRTVAYVVKVVDAWITLQEDRGYNKVQGPREAYKTLKRTNFAEYENDTGHLPYLKLVDRIVEAVGNLYSLPPELDPGT